MQEISVPGTLDDGAFAKKERLQGSRALSVDSDRFRICSHGPVQPLRRSYDAALYFIQVTTRLEAIAAVALRISGFNHGAAVNTFC